MPKANSKHIQEAGLNLSMISVAGGWEYEWRDPATGKCLAGGWLRGSSRRDAEKEALHDIKELCGGKLPKP